MFRLWGDYCNYNASGVVLHVGGNYNQNQNHGAFYLNGNNAASNSNANIGARFLVNGSHDLMVNTPTSGGVLHGCRFRTPLGEDCVDRDGLSTPERAKERLIDNKETIPMKRMRDAFTKIISEDNLRKAIKTVCDSHRWVHYPNKPNNTVIYLEAHMDKKIEELRNLIVNGFEPSPVTIKRRYDVNAGKWREISEPRLWPDQCVHHALIQAIEPVMMRGMDYYCCGSIKKRGAHYGISAIKKWLQRGKGVKYCIELDIHHFYDSLKPQLVLARMKQLIKDRLALDLIWRVIQNGIQIGAYCSQWFANTFLQPLDQLIRNSGATKYLRYMDNFTIFTNRKRTADKLIAIIREWLQTHSLDLKGNWQKFRTAKRMPNALGYRFGKDYILIRKKNRLRLKQQLKRYYRMRERGEFITCKFAQGLLSRLGMLRHCNSVSFYEQYVKRKTQKHLKDIVRDYYRKEMLKWNTSLEPQKKMA